MNKTKTFIFIAGVLVLSAWGIPILFSQLANTVTIGVAEEVDKYVRGVRPDGEKRTIHQDDPVYFGDKVMTFTDGYLKIRLLDDTTFVLGPRTTVVLDEFVYDPNTDEGKINASVVRGVFRFLTGKIVKNEPESMEVHLPIATIGVRGTQAVSEVRGRRETVLLEKHEGGADGALNVSATINGTKVEVDISTPGQGTIVTAAAGPSSPATLPKKDADRMQDAVASPQMRKLTDASKGFQQRRSDGGKEVDGQNALERKVVKTKDHYQ